MAKLFNFGARRAAEQTLRDVNQALVQSTLRQHEHLEKAQEAEAGLRAIEAELRQRAEELMRFNRAAVGRERRMIELKDEVNNIAIRHGESPHYSREEILLDTVALKAADTPPHIAALGSDVGEVAPLADVLCTELLAERPSRPPAYNEENIAIRLLVSALTSAPGEILQALSQTILNTLKADSAGVSLLSRDKQSFYWPAIAGEWSGFIGGGTPRNFGPCGDVLDRDSPLLMQHVERRYTYFLPVKPLVEEALLVPFYVEGKCVGTIWAVSHGEKRFDLEDLRQLRSLGQFASTAYQASEECKLEIARRAAALNLMEDAVQARDAVEESRRQAVALEHKSQELANSLVDINRRKDEFLAMLSHELRNPLASIRNASHIMRLQQEKNSIHIEAQSLLDRQVRQLVRLIDDLLEVSRIATGRIHLDIEPVDARALVDRVVDSFRPQAEQKGQALRAPEGEAQPIWLNGDAVRLEQLVANLIGNAIKYTDRGGSITVSLQEDDGEAILRVADNGVGISPEMLPKVFELFTQVDNSLSRSQGGLGIGLALVKSIVELHHGRIAAHSTVGKGSEFVVCLPLHKVPQAEAEDPAVSAVAPIKLLKIMVVDDNIDAARSMSVILKATGHEVQLAHDGQSALDAARDFQPDVMLLNIGLPVLDGYEVAERVRRDPSIAHVVLIAVTGYGNAADKERSRVSGFAQHLVKPVDYATLSEALSAIAGAAE